MAKSENASISHQNSSEPRPWQSYHTVYTNAKAGMDGVDKEKVQRIVYEMSKGSKYFENEERKEAYMKQKIENMHAQCAKLTSRDITHYQKAADKRILELEATRDLSRIWLHVDMDAFYATVETLCDPTLKGKPMAVGSLSMISTANYEARKFGVRAAMPGFIARKLCPELIFVPVDFKKYTHYSNLTRQVFQKYDPHFLVMSLDEAYLDITNVWRERGITGEEVAQELRETVHSETGLTCSAGVASNRLLAKVCSDINKPNGQFVLPNDRTAVMTFISSLPIRKIGGIGKVTEHILKDVLGITTCEEMLQKSGFLCALFSRSSADFFLSVGLGLGGTDTPEVRMRKSISNERTFAATKDEALLYQMLVDLAETLSADMRKEGLRGRTLTLKLKTSSFEVRTRAVTLPDYMCSSEDILRHASKLLKAELPVSLRLMGLRMSQFNEERNGAPSDPTQKTLSDFVLGNASGRKIGGHTQLGSYCNNDVLSVDHETCLSSENHETCVSRELVDDSQPSDLKHGDCIFRHNSEVEDESLGYHSDVPSGNKNDGNAGGQPLVSRGGGNLQLVTEYPSQKQSEESSLRNGNSWITHADLDAGSSPSHKEPSGSSSSHKEPFFWVDNYKCSLCGVELPSNFIEERQEHSDFHLAERLQQEESRENSNNILKQRSMLKDHIVAHNRPRKKNKSSTAGSKHLPIDAFFTKTSRNF